MWLFFLLIFLTLFLAVVFQNDNYKSSKRYLFVMFSIIGFLIMFRSVNVGNDTDIYTDLFNYIAKSKNISLFIEETRYEPGYVYLNWFLSKISNDPQILLIATGFFTALSFWRFIYHYSEMPWLSVFMFMTLQFYDLTLTGIRQIVAISILLYAYDFLVKRKLIYFLITVLFACTIHTSAIMFLLLYPITSGKLRTKKFYILSGFAAMVTYVGFPYLLNVLNMIFPQYIKYFTEDNDSYSSTAKLAIVLMLLLYILLFIIAKSNKNSNSIQSDLIPETKDKRMFVKFPDISDNIMEISIWLGIIMLFLALQGTILNRFKYVFSSAMLVYYPNMLKRINNSSIRYLLIAGSCFVFFVYILVIYILRPEWQSSYPYSFFWTGKNMEF